MAKKSSESSRRAGLKSMKSEDIKNRQWDEKERRALRRAAELQAAGDDSRINFEDIPRLTEDQLARMLRLRDVRPKIAVSVRLDPQVLDWLKSKGQGHLTRINDILTNLMEAERRLPPGR
jgi:uncharacterized protein (DUF4415 family)